MLNLDTHMLVFALCGQLRPQEKALLTSNRWGVSAIVLWELTKLFELGRITLDIQTPAFARVLSRTLVWPLDLAVCRRIGTLDFRADPADEIIAATSLVHNVPLLTRDRLLRGSKVVQTVP